MLRAPAPCADARISTGQPARLHCISACSSPLESGGDRGRRAAALGLAPAAAPPERTPAAANGISHSRHRRRRSPAVQPEKMPAQRPQQRIGFTPSARTRSVTLSRSDSFPIPTVNTRSSSVVSEESPMQASASASVTCRHLRARGRTHIGDKLLQFPPRQTAIATEAGRQIGQGVALGLQARGAQRLQDELAQFLAVVAIAGHGGGVCRALEKLAQR